MVNSVSEGYHIYNCGDQQIAVNIANPLGRGSSGTVYSAYPIENDTIDDSKPMAVKIYDPRNKKNTLEAIQAEANVQSIFIESTVYQASRVDSNDENKTLLMVMPKIPGQPIVQFKNNQHSLHPQLDSLTLRERLTLAVLVAQTYYEFHQNRENRDGMVHSDLKPDNVLIDIIRDEKGVASFQCRIIDFTNKNATTIETLAPEITDAKDCNEQSDMYALTSIIATILGETEVFKLKMAEKGILTRQQAPFHLDNMKRYLNKQKSDRKDIELSKKIDDVILTVQSMGEKSPDARTDDLTLVRKLNTAKVVCKRKESQPKDTSMLSCIKYTLFYEKNPRELRNVIEEAFSATP